MSHSYTFQMAGVARIAREVPQAGRDGIDLGCIVEEQLRDEVKQREGAAFDIKAFHKRALDLGGVGLDTLKSSLLGA